MTTKVTLLSLGLYKVEVGEHSDPACGSLVGGNYQANRPSDWLSGCPSWLSQTKACRLPMLSSSSVCVPFETQEQNPKAHADAHGGYGFARMFKGIITKLKHPHPIRKISVYPRELLLLLCMGYLGRGLQ